MWTGWGKTETKKEYKWGGGGGCKTLQLQLRVDIFNENLIQFGFRSLFLFESKTRKLTKEKTQSGHPFFSNLNEQHNHPTGRNIFVHTEQIFQKYLYLLSISQLTELSTRIPKSFLKRPYLTHSIVYWFWKPTWVLKKEYKKKFLQGKIMLSNNFTVIGNRILPHNRKFVQILFTLAFFYIKKPKEREQNRKFLNLYKIWSVDSFD